MKRMLVLIGTNMALLVTSLTFTNPAFGLTIGELRHQAIAGTVSQSYLGPVGNISIADGTGQFRPLDPTGRLHLQRLQ